MKIILILLLAAAIFGGGTYAAWKLYIKPHQDLQMERASGPASPPPDPTLPEYEKRIAAQDSQSLIDARNSWTDFIERFPESSKINEAKDILGKLNTAIFLSPIQTPEKEVYIVKSGDVITRVAQRLKTSPELLMRSNNMQGSMLRIGQKLLVSPNDFSMFISRRAQKVTLLNKGKFFKQYSILKMPGHSAAAGPAKKNAAPTPRPPKIQGKVTDRIAWYNGTRVNFTDKEFGSADHWVIVSPPGHSLYSERPAVPNGPPAQKPTGGGYVLAAEDLRELAALLKKNDPVTID